MQITKILIETEKVFNRNKSEYADIYISSAINPWNGCGFSFHRDFSEFSMVINAIDSYKDRSDCLILDINDVFDKQLKIIDSNGVQITGTVIDREYDLMYHYAQHLRNDWKDSEVKDFYAECSDKSKMLPKEFLDLCNHLPYDISSIVLDKAACDRVMRNFYDLNKSPYSFTKFGVMTWYPMANLFPALTLWRSNG